MSRLAVLPLFALVACASTESTEAGSTPKKNSGKADDKPRMCTEMACFDAATIETKLGPSGAPLGKHELALDIDGKAESCTVDFTEVTSTAFGTCSNPNITLVFGPVTTGKEERMGGVVAYTEVPVPGEFRWMLTLPGTPTKVHVVHTQAGVTIVDQHAVLSDYHDHRPNGEGCEPVCKTTRVEWKGP